MWEDSVLCPTLYIVWSFLRQSEHVMIIGKSSNANMPQHTNPDMPMCNPSTLAALASTSMSGCGVVIVSSHNDHCVAAPERNDFPALISNLEKPNRGLRA